MTAWINLIRGGGEIVNDPRLRLLWRQAEIIADYMKLKAKSVSSKPLARRARRVGKASACVLT